jgi:hypothetical protein
LKYKYGTEKLLETRTKRVCRILRRTGLSLMFTFVNAIMVHTREMHSVRNEKAELQMSNEVVLSYVPQYGTEKLLETRRLNFKCPTKWYCHMYHSMVRRNC